MRFSKPDIGDSLPYSVIKIQGCTDQAVGFTLLREEPTVAKRRYCNKVLVHECDGIEVAEPLDLDRVEFIATSDPCYRIFEIFKTSLDSSPSTIEFELDGSSNVTHISIIFPGTETSSMPIALSYRMYGYLATTDEKIMLSQGILYVTPCGVFTSCDREFWTDVAW